MDTAMLQGAELLAATMSHIEANPERHNQSDWMRVGMSCGTAACLAGWAVLLSGVPIDPDSAELASSFSRNQRWAVRIDDGKPVLVERSLMNWEEENRLEADGVLMGIGSYATDLLGLSGYNASVLFCSSNTREELRGMVDTLLEDPGVGLELPESAL